MAPAARPRPSLTLRPMPGISPPIARIACRLRVLLEVALQACGWMAAYMGSALTSDGDLKFRNLGGTGRQHLPVTRHTGTLTTRVRVTKISSTAGMILQHYEFAVDCRTGWSTTARTEFGFFQPPALAQQVGIRDATPTS